MSEPKRLKMRTSRFWTRARRLTAFGFLLLLFLGREDWFPWVKGSMTSTRLFNVIPILDPLSGLEILLSSRFVPTELLIGMGILIVVYMILGRVFCGWVCPLGLILDLNDQFRMFLRKKLNHYGIKLPEWTLPHSSKNWVLAGCLVVTLLVSLPVFTMISPINIVVLSVIYPAGPEVLIIPAIMFTELFSPRLFCRSICPLGAFYSLIGHWGILKMRTGGAEAEQLLCHQCTLHCPMGIRVMEDHVMEDKLSVDDPDCTRCGSCAEVCMGHVLHLGFHNVPRSDEPKVAVTLEQLTNPK